MGDLFLLSERQMARISPHFPLSHGVPRVDDRRVVSGIVYVIRNGLQWKDAPKDYGPHKTLYNRFIRWSRLGVFDRIFASACRRRSEARAHDDRRDPSEGPSHRGEPAQKGDVPRRIGRTKGGLNSKLHAVCDGEGRPLILLLSRGPDERPQGRPPRARRPAASRYPIADQATTATGSAKHSQREASSPASRHRQSRKTPFAYDKVLYRQRHKIENMFAKLKDWRRIATRYDRCAHTFFSAICIAAAVIFWLNQ